MSELVESFIDFRILKSVKSSKVIFSTVDSIRFWYKNSRRLKRDIHTFTFLLYILCGGSIDFGVWVFINKSSGFQIDILCVHGWMCKKLHVWSNFLEILCLKVLLTLNNMTNPQYCKFYGSKVIELFCDFPHKTS